MVSPLHLCHADTDEEEERGANDVERDSNTIRSKLLPCSYCFFILSVASSPKSKAEDADEEEEEEDNNDADGEEKSVLYPNTPETTKHPVTNISACFLFLPLLLLLLLLPLLAILSTLFVVVIAFSSSHAFPFPSSIDATTEP